MGWDNTTELTANVVDSLAYLIRLYVNVNSETPNTDPVERVPRPGDQARPSPGPSAPDPISLADFTGLLEEHS